MKISLRNAGHAGIVIQKMMMIMFIAEKETVSANISHISVSVKN